jgi:hypothetical protein
MVWLLNTYLLLLLDINWVLIETCILITGSRAMEDTDYFENYYFNPRRYRKILSQILSEKRSYGIWYEIIHLLKISFHGW